MDLWETIDLSVTVQNTGDADASSVSGTLSTTTPGIAITAGSASFPDVAAGLTGTSLVPFQFVAAPGVVCGTLIDFTLDLTYEDSVGNPFSNSTSPPFQVQVGQDVPPVTHFLTTFDDCADPPTSVCATCVPVDGNWTVLNNGNQLGWTHAGPGCPSACEWGLFPTNYYLCDSNCPVWETVHDEELISPVVDASAASTVTLRFDGSYYNYASPTSSDVNVRSSKTGGAWVTLRDFALGCMWWGDCAPAGTGSFVFDITAECAGAADCQVEFHQETNYYDSWWWAVDNVALEESVVCNPNCGCALDGDADGLANCTDNCPADANPLQEDADLDDIGDLCDVCPNDPYNDIDGDDVCGDVDNCPADANPAQTDADSDGAGDACDACPGFDDGLDADSDGTPDGCDLCPGFDDRLDADGDGTPDGCDTCTDTDGDGLGDPGFPANTCATDPCPAIPSVPSGCTPVGGTYPTDINCDGCVDGMDLGFIGRAFGEFCGDPYYNADADVDASDTVDGTDLNELIVDFGKGCT